MMQDNVPTCFISTKYCRVSCFDFGFILRKGLAIDFFSCIHAVTDNVLNKFLFDILHLFLFNIIL